MNLNNGCNINLFPVSEPILILSSFFGLNFVPVSFALNSFWVELTIRMRGSEIWKGRRRLKTNARSGTFKKPYLLLTVCIMHWYHIRTVKVLRNNYSFNCSFKNQINASYFETWIKNRHSVWKIQIRIFKKCQAGELLRSKDCFTEHSQRAAWVQLAEKS